MVNLKYAVVERERRWLLTIMPDDLVGEMVLIRDRYLTGTRLRLREITDEEGSRVLKLGHKVRLDEGETEGPRLARGRGRGCRRVPGRSKRSRTGRGRRRWKACSSRELGGPQRGD